QIPLGRLPANLEPGRRGSNRHADAAENDRPRRNAAVRERRVEERGIARKRSVRRIVDELARLAVAPSEHTDAGPDIRHDGGALSERQHAERRGEWHDAEFEISVDVAAAVGVLIVDVEGGHRLLVVTDTGAGFKEMAESDEVLAAERHSLEAI